MALLLFNTAKMYAKQRGRKVVTQVREGCVTAVVKAHSGRTKAAPITPVCNRHNIVLTVLM